MTTRAHLILTALMLLAAAATAGGQTITVTIASDTVDIDWTVATIDDLPGPDGEISFSEAIIATNHTPGHQTIGFAIPTDQWILQFILPGRAVLTSITGFFFNVTDEVTIDGTTQTAFTGDTNPDGWEVAIYGDNLGLNAPNCTLIGFDSTDISVSGTGCVIDGNTGSMNISVFGGSGGLIKDNAGGTIKIDRSSDNVVVGNTVQRVRVLGFGTAQPAAGNRIGGPNPEDRNFLIGYGTWNSEGLPAGMAVQLSDTTGTVIENNWIGTTPDGLAQGNLACTMGIHTQGEHHDLVIRDNRIAGILGHGQGPHHAGQLFGWAILIGGSGGGITITGNTVGLDANDEPLLGSVYGIDIGGFNYNGAGEIRVGGTGAGEGNVVAGHIWNGVTVAHDVPQARITGNSIYGNGLLGIDLIPSTFGFGVTANDPLDTDTGGNDLQNFPEIDTATREGTATRVTGALHSVPLTDFSIELFASPECDPSGFGEGEVFLGSAAIATDAAGDADFDVTLPVSVADDWIVTATATLEPIGATSEFSACVLVTGEGISNDINGDGVVNVEDLLVLLGAWGDCPDPSDCPADLDGDGVVNVEDLLALLAAWG